MKELCKFFAAAFALASALNVSTSWAEAFSGQVESVSWSNQSGTALFDFTGASWPGFDDFAGGPGQLGSPPYEINAAALPPPTLTATGSLELSTLPSLASFDVAMPNYFWDGTTATPLAIQDAEFVVTFKEPPSPGLTYNVAIQSDLEPTVGLSDRAILTLVTECSPEGVVTYGLKFSDEVGVVDAVPLPDFDSIALRIEVDGQGTATASYFLDPAGDILDPGLISWVGLTVPTDLDSLNPDAGRYATFFNISADCQAPDCLQIVIPAPNVGMAVTGMKVNLRNGRFMIKGFLDVTDPAFQALVQNPLANVGLQLQTGGTTADPEFGISAGDQIQLRTKKNKLRFKFKKKKDEEDSEDSDD